MKKNVFLLIVSMLFAGSLFAQSYRTYTASNAKSLQNGIFYSLPETELVVTVKVEKTTRVKGIYSDKAYLLGLDNSAVNNSVSYKIKDIQLGTKAVASSSNRYFLTYNGKTSVDVSENGILRSITLVGEKLEKTNAGKHQQCLPQSATVSNQTPSLLNVRPTFETDLISQGLMTSYPFMSAEKVVAEIKALRQKQVDILSGSMEGTYLNTTVDYMYNQLDEMIKGYITLFTGVATTEEEEYTFSVVPQKPIIVEEDLLVPIFKFSKENGVSELNERNEDAKIVARIHSLNTAASTIDAVLAQTSDRDFKAKIEKNGVGIYYTIPEQVKVTIESSSEVFTNKVVKLAQYGTTAVLTDGTANIQFDEATGAILKLWK
ncbi:MAG: DUF4831 family protein [Bacteroidales bacterium]|nr:DUF4831 family protein [Candidatus Scybalousia scybalohippi]